LCANRPVRASRLGMNLGKIISSIACFYLRIPCRLTYDLLGFVTGMDASNAKRNQDTGISILMSMLSDNGYAPIRTFENVAEFENFFREYDTLIIDGSEQPIQRPSEEDSQKDNYSGKKKGIR
ncbi:hypothetical protein, partial [Persicitalea sp.]|uniref:hypothetical protein n=1 Tax=Persicitalea sp. TaxID=3100273 RepID=UPI003593A807